MDQPALRESRARAVSARESLWPSLEVRIKSLNYVGDLLLKELKRFHDRRPVLELYMRGELEVHHHTVEGYCATTSVTLARRHRKKPMVFVGVGKVAELPRPFAPTTRCSRSSTGIS